MTFDRQLTENRSFARERRRGRPDHGDSTFHFYIMRVPRSFPTVGARPDLAGDMVSPARDQVIWSAEEFPGERGPSEQASEDDREAVEHAAYGELPRQGELRGTWTDSTNEPWCSSRGGWRGRLVRPRRAAARDFRSSTTRRTRDQGAWRSGRVACKEIQCQDRPRLNGRPETSAQEERQEGRGQPGARSPDG